MVSIIITNFMLNSSNQKSQDTMKTRNLTSVEQSPQFIKDKNILEVLSFSGGLCFFSVCVYTSSWTNIFLKMTQLLHASIQGEKLSFIGMVLYLNIQETKQLFKFYKKWKRYLRKLLNYKTFGVVSL
ncbi:hypothetical protein KIL84_006666 [Mauremys mutica]|uniref:Uncharacterized protein n=1 Tax=Mauremys mutica TaxID=74926 RepID=A0A9D3X1V3_9SAUR|nr:hypothetical protein KIL84_006666 [Mauremys mutica]